MAERMAFLGRPTAYGLYGLYVWWTDMPDLVVFSCLVLPPKWNFFELLLEEMAKDEEDPAEAYEATVLQDGHSM